MSLYYTTVNHTYTFDEVQANCNQINLLTMNIKSLTGRLNSDLSFLHQRLRIHEHRMDIKFML